MNCIYFVRIRRVHLCRKTKATSVPFGVTRQIPSPSLSLSIKKPAIQMSSSIGISALDDGLSPEWIYTLKLPHR